MWPSSVTQPRPALVCVTDGAGASGLGGETLDSLRAGTGKGQPQGPSRRGRLASLQLRPVTRGSGAWPLGPGGLCVCASPPWVVGVADRKRAPPGSARGGPFPSGPRKTVAARGASVRGWPLVLALMLSQGQKFSTGHELYTRNAGCSVTQRHSPTGR